MGGAASRVICWDLDETLGRFRPPEGNGPHRNRGLTRGIRTILEEHLDSGCRHVVTTAAEASYAATTLDEFGITRYFDGIFDRSIICDGRFNKSYLSVASRFGVPPEEAPDRIIVVGNLAKDAPADSDIVFLYHPNAIDYEAGVLNDTLRYMESFGSWKAAQEALALVSNPRI